MTVTNRVGGVARRWQKTAAAALVALSGSLLPPLAHTAAAAESTAWFNTELGYAQLLEQGHDGSGVTVAVAESGVDLDSPDLQGADIEFVPMPDECAPLRDIAKQEKLTNLDGVDYEGSVNHGTNVAAMIVGQGGPDRIQGVAPRAKLLVMETPFVLRPSSSKWPSECDPAKVLSAGRMADAERHGADILSISVVGPIQPGNYDNAYWQMQDRALVTGAGNRKMVEAESAGLPGVVAVTATKQGNKATDWASAGTEVTVGAPGEGLVLRGSDGKLSTNGAGTSFSAPIVAGTLALGRQQWPDATYNQLIRSLTATATGGGAVSDELGYGGIDPVKFIQNDPSQYPDEPLLYPDSINADPEWLAVRDVCEGFLLDETLGYPSNYRVDAGINPEVVKWLPQEAKDEGWLGAAPEADSWGAPAPGESERTDAAGDSATSQSRPLGSFPVIVIGIIAAFVVIAVVVIVVVVVVIVASRKKKQPAHVAPPQGMFPPGGQPHGYQAPPGSTNGPPGGYSNGYPNQFPGEQQRSQPPS
ncbi:S8 family serine peptidase [uncultured Gulosibacter sp.]|uniref:S8 family serine peptidase n=1 Tax=uncultured Gulosibacter sp. TaxID=1339167 RepID=UPI00288937E7|nr:S8 family serine peptidase [uncultured Gulosibacter sp.]